MNLSRIGQISGAECERQQVGLTELSSLLTAYKFTVWGDIDLSTVQGFEAAGYYVEPIVNRSGFRTTPVTFRDGGTSAPAAEIPRLMENLCGMIQAEQERPSSAHDKDAVIKVIVKEFLWIHPFADGNGRVGWILYNFLRGTMDYPDPLPDYFGGNNG